VQKINEFGTVTKQCNYLENGTLVIYDYCLIVLNLLGMLGPISKCSKQFSWHIKFQINTIPYSLWVRYGFTDNRPIHSIDDVVWSKTFCRRCFWETAPLTCNYRRFICVA
jgi:hypothetical protein